jgi:beta-glucanase (GH16 family)
MNRIYQLSLLVICFLSLGSVELIAQTAYSFPCTSCTGTPQSSQSSFCTPGTWTGPLPPNPSGSYQLIFQDNFNGTQINTDHWELSGNAVANDLCCNKEENVILSNGECRIRVKNDPNSQCNYVHSWDPPNIEQVTRQFSDGGLISKQFYGPGRFEIRCKIPWIMGMWPAFWLYAAVDEDGRPASYIHHQEIDVFEMVQDAPTSNCTFNNGCKDINLNSYQIPDDASKRIIGTYHYAEPFVEYGNHCSAQRCYNYGAKLDDAFHTYAVEWDADEIRWYLDGTFFASANRYYWDASQNSYVKQVNFPNALVPMKIIISNGLRYSTAFNNMQSCSPMSNYLPMDLVVDYVKVYARCSSVTPRTLCYSTDGAYLTAPNDAFYDGAINFSNTCQVWNVNSGQKLLAGGGQVSVKNFHAYPGSKVIIRASVNCNAVVSPLRLTNEPNNEPNKENTPNPIHSSSLAIVPNPSDGNFKLSFLNKNEGNLTVSIFDINGRKVYSEKGAFSAGQVTMDIGSGLISGIYLIRIEETGETARFVIN